MNTSISWKSILNRLTLRQDLSHEEITWAMDDIMNGNASEAIIGAFLIALHVKGETPEELDALAQGMLEKAEPININNAAVDIVGTGGDQQNTVNISTMAAIVIAASGAPVIKHGNRSSSSSTGSADVLEALGVRLEMPIASIPDCLSQTGIAFLFAQVFHPSMKYVAPTRKKLGVPTAFNYLGPMTNPAKVRSSAIGVADESMARKIADVFASRQDHALIFRGGDGLDEVTITANTQVWETIGGGVYPHVIDPREFGYARATLDDLRGGDAEHNAKVFRDIMHGLRGPIRDAVVLNAAAGIVAFNEHDVDQPFMSRYQHALNTAEKTLDSGSASHTLEAWVAYSQSVVD
ncbi:anthranilate phosphoribosyltransferase [Rothia sp. LK2588]|uniref:anthranilate phosphoribosyltransferase n=1 Tax=Rothia sp. LK2588 TaxID=3114369 RepID=UPI0034CD34CD